MRQTVDEQLSHAPIPPPRRPSEPTRPRMRETIDEQLSHVPYFRHPFFIIKMMHVPSGIPVHAIWGHFMYAERDNNTQRTSRVPTNSITWDVEYKQTRDSRKRFAHGVHPADKYFMIQIVGRYFGSQDRACIYILSARFVFDDDFCMFEFEVQISESQYGMEEGIKVGIPANIAPEVRPDPVRSNVPTERHARQPIHGGRVPRTCYSIVSDGEHLLNRTFGPVDAFKRAYPEERWLGNRIYHFPNMETR